MDRKIPKYSTGHFLVDPEFSKISEGPQFSDEIIANAAPHNKAALMELIGKKGAFIDHRFGLKAADWLKNNIDQFDPRQHLDLYDMFQGLKEVPPGYINPDRVPDRTEPLPIPRMVPPGGVRG